MLPESRSASLDWSTEISLSTYGSALSRAPRPLILIEIELRTYEDKAPPKKSQPEKAAPEAFFKVEEVHYC